LCCCAVTVFTLWHYTSTDAAAMVDNSGYFNAADMLRVGDMIMANTATAASPAAGILLVATNSGGAVDVANLTQIGAGNTD
jgi:hypothetical protein